MSEFRVEPYSRGHLPGMVDLYNRETAFEPHIARFTEERFLTLVEAKSYFDPAGLFVACAGGEAIGWVHACVAPTTEPWQQAGRTMARIRMLIFPRERMKVGAALVTAATRWLRDGGATEIEALHPAWGYPFYRGLWMGGEPMCPVTLPHVQMALSVQGYALDFESIVMTAKMGAPPPQPSGLALEFGETLAEMTHDGMRESWTGFAPARTRARLAGEEVGAIGWVLLPHVAEKLGAPCLNVWSLSVSEQHRRKGIGLALVREAMRRGYAHGARVCSVGTQLWNAPAHATYAAAGFTPHCIVVGRKLTVQNGT